MCFCRPGMLTVLAHLGDATVEAKGPARPPLRPPSRDARGVGNSVTRQAVVGVKAIRSSGRDTNVDVGEKSSQSSPSGRGKSLLLSIKPQPRRNASPLCGRPNRNADDKAFAQKRMGAKCTTSSCISWPLSFPNVASQRNFRYTSFPEFDCLMLAIVPLLGSCGSEVHGHLGIFTQVFAQGG